MREDDEEVNLRETMEDCKSKLFYIKERIKTIDFWLDNLTLILLIAVVVYFAVKGHYTDTRIIEVCNGIPLDLNTTR